MFCPKCGYVLSNKEDKLFCLHGNMELTKELGERLHEVFSLKLRPPRDMQFTFKIGGKWFCPQCGISTVEENGYVRCPKCKHSMNEFIHSLVERHYHHQTANL